MVTRAGAEWETITPVKLQVRRGGDSLILQQELSFGWRPYSIADLGKGLQAQHLPC